MPTLSGLLERALAQASLKLYDRERRVRFRVLVQNSLRTDGKYPLGWYTMSEWLERSSVNRDVMMAIGPRWNCHALIAMSGFFPVRRSLTFRCDQADASAAYWTIVIYDTYFRTVRHLGNASGTPVSPIHEVALEPGRYTLGLRYYGASAGAVLPEVRVDGEAALASRSASGEEQRYHEYLESLSEHGTLKQLCLQFHAYAFLKHRDHYDESWLCKRYLPVGNPETGFLYGAVEKGQVLRVRGANAGSGHTYVSIYDRRSQPVHWARVDDRGEFVINESGTYLVRHVSRAGNFVPADLKVDVMGTRNGTSP